MLFRIGAAVIVAYAMVRIGGSLVINVSLRLAARRAIRHAQSRVVASAAG